MSTCSKISTPVNCKLNSKITLWTVVTQKPIVNILRTISKGTHCRRCAQYTKYITNAGWVNTSKYTNRISGLFFKNMTTKKNYISQKYEEGGKLSIKEKRKILKRKLDFLQLVTFSFGYKDRKTLLFTC